jgi:hypothetical protein
VGTTEHQQGGPFLCKKGAARPRLVTRHEVGRRLGENAGVSINPRAKYGIRPFTKGEYRRVFAVKTYRHSADSLTRYHNLIDANWAKARGQRCTGARSIEDRDPKANVVGVTR